MAETNFVMFFSSTFWERRSIT